MGKDPDSRPLNRDDPGGRGGVPGVGDETRVVRRTDQTEDEHADDVEQEDPDPDTANRTWQGFRRVVGFSGSDPDDLGPQEGISSTDQDGPEASEPAQRSRNLVVLNERTGLLLRQVKIQVMLCRSVVV